MSWRAKFWWGVAAVSVLVNAGGAVYALRGGEWMHGGSHVVLLVLTLYLVELLRNRPAKIVRDLVQPESPEDVRMAQLQQSLDAIAIEVERIGEAQRFSAKLQSKPAEGASDRR